VARYFLKNKFYSGPKEKENGSVPIFLNYNHRYTFTEDRGGRRKVMFRMKDTTKHQIHTAAGPGDKVVLEWSEMEHRHFWGRRLTWMYNNYTIDYNATDVFQSLRRARSWILPCFPQAFPGYTPCDDKNRNCSEHIPVTINDIVARTGNVIYSPAELGWY